MTSNWFISEPVSLYPPFNQISEVLLGISTLDHSYIFYYNMEYEKTEKRKRVERGRLSYSFPNIKVSCISV